MTASSTSGRCVYSPLKSWTAELCCAIGGYVAEGCPRGFMRDAQFSGDRADILRDLRAGLRRQTPSYMDAPEYADEQLLDLAYKQVDFVQEVLDRNAQFVDYLTDKLADAGSLPGETVMNYWLLWREYRRMD